MSDQFFLSNYLRWKRFSPMSGSTTFKRTKKYQAFIRVIVFSYFLHIPRFRASTLFLVTLQFCSLNIQNRVRRRKTKIASPLKKANQTTTTDATKSGDLTPDTRRYPNKAFNTVIQPNICIVKFDDDIRYGGLSKFKDEPRDNKKKSQKHTYV